MFGFAATQALGQEKGSGVIDLTKGEDQSGVVRPTIHRKGTLKQSHCSLTSVKELRASLDADAHKGGCLDSDSEFYRMLSQADRP